METTKQLFDTLHGFDPISLEQLNSTVSFLDRIDVKYLVHVSQLPDIIRDLQGDFSVLNIKDRSIFNYDNVYMDTQDYLFYNQHQSGEKNRSKVRIRHYVDAGDLVFFEFKQKAKGVTRKFRYEYGLKNHGKMTSEAMKFYEGVYASMYGQNPIDAIFPAIGSRYQRFTLCSKDNTERITIDMNLEIIELRDNENYGKVIKIPNVAIVESKSMHQHCRSHEIMQQLDIAKADACSKYCLGIYYMGHCEKWSKFQPTIDRIETIKNIPTRKKAIKKSQPISTNYAIA